jgi:hypothetical protein
VEVGGIESLSTGTIPVFGELELGGLGALTDPATRKDGRASGGTALAPLGF